MDRILYIAHPIGGDEKNNLRKVKAICSIVHHANNNLVPFAPYLGNDYLQDDVAEDRLLGIEFNELFFVRKTIDETGLFGPHISSGMGEEVLLSLENNIPVRCYEPHLQFDLEEFLLNRWYDPSLILPLTNYQES